jgi:hypothetical protein
VRKLDDGFPSDVGASSEPQHAVRIGESQTAKGCGVVWCAAHPAVLSDRSSAWKGDRPGDEAELWPGGRLGVGWDGAKGPDPSGKTDAASK